MRAIMTGSRFPKNVRRKIIIGALHPIQEIMLAKLTQHAAAATIAALRKRTHCLIVLPVSKDLSPAWPGGDVLASLLTRRRMKAGELAKSPVTGNLKDGALASWMMLDPKKPAFEQHAALRGALQPLLGENPAEIAIAVCGDAAQRHAAAQVATYCAWVNGAVLPERKRKASHKPLKEIHLYGTRDGDDFAELRARAEGNILCRELTMLPPNELTPGTIPCADQRARQRTRMAARGIRLFAAQENGRGCVLRSGPGQRNARCGNRAPALHALTRETHCSGRRQRHLLRYRRAQSQARTLHVCDARGHERLRGRARHHGRGDADEASVNLDCWLAISRNDISPRAYHQNEVVRALNGTTIEVMHTDAEGRMVLADTLTLAARAKPDLIIDFATLTGTMHSALGERYSGIFATSDELGAQAVAAGRLAGERVCVFPQDDDYDSALDSKIADVKQCSLDAAADHILATRFLKRFVGNTPWIHVDLSASSAKGGLGAVASDTTGFGVGWALELLAAQLN
jgi:leucyl aminopeptidase